MNELSNFKNNIIDYFSSIPAFNQYSFSDEFPSKIKSNPLDHTHIVFYFSKISLPNSIESFIGKSINDNKDVYGNIANIDMAFDIYSSISYSSTNCLIAFEEISEVMIKNFSFSNISSSNLIFNKTLSCFVLPCSFKTSIIISSPPSFPNISNFKVISQKL